MIKFVNKKNVRSQILSVDPIRFAELEEENLDHFLMRFVFKIKLNVAAINPEDYSRVDVSIVSPSATTNKAKTSEKQTKLNPNFSTLSSTLTKSSTSKLKFNSAGQKVYKPEVSIPKLALDKINKILMPFALEKQQAKSSDYLTKVSVFINSLITDALNKKCIVQLFDIPEEVSLDQGARLTQDRIINSNMIKEINDTFRLPTNYINSLNTHNELFGKKIIDHFIHDTNQPPENFLSTVNFYKIKTDFTNLSVLEIPVRIKIPISLKNSALQIKFDLFEKNSKLPLESITMSLDAKSYFEAYYALSSTPSVDYVSSRGGTAATLAFSYDAFDKHKVVSFNIYAKTLKNGKFTEFQFLRNIDVFDLRLKQSIFSLKNFSLDELAVARIVPVTKFGESEKFTDIVLGNGKLGATGKRLALRLLQDFNELGTVRAMIENVTNLAEIMKIYQRDCTNSPDAYFKHKHTVSLAGLGSTSFVDRGLIPGHFYEYYIECLDKSGGNIVQTSDPALVEIQKFQKDDSRISVTNTNIINDEVSFTISTFVKDSKSSLFKNALSKLLDPAAQARFDPVSVISTDEKKEDLKDLYFHEITRISEATSERYTMGVVADGVFTDNRETRKILGGVPPPVPGGTYYYQITTYKRDLLSTNKNYIASGRKNNQDWFYSPYKWRNPKVALTGILFSEDNFNTPEISDRDLLLMQPVSILNSLKYTIPGAGGSSVITPIASSITRKTHKIQWNSLTNFNFDSFVVVKVVNGKKTILGSTSKNYFYHKIEENDLGTVYYEVTPIDGNDYSVQNTYFSNSIFVLDDTSERILRND